jgi:hypothetical protein
MGISCAGADAPQPSGRVGALPLGGLAILEACCFVGAAGGVAGAVRMGAGARQRAPIDDQVFLAYRTTIKPALQDLAHAGRIAGLRGQRRPRHVWRHQLVQADVFSVHTATTCLLGVVGGASAPARSKPVLRWCLSGQRCRSHADRVSIPRNQGGCLLKEQRPITKERANLAPSGGRQAPPSFDAALALDVWRLVRSRLRRRFVPGVT